MRCLLATLALGLQVGCAPEPERPPNFVVFMADDLGAPELASYGHPTHRTPHLDRLADEGVRFRTAYATPICTPSRVMIMTGRYGFRTGWYNFRGRSGSPTYTDSTYNLGDAELTFADVLGDAGYATAVVGKWQLGGTLPDFVYDTGFDEYRIWAYTHNLPPGVEHTGGMENRTRTARFWHPSIMENGRYVPTTPDDYGPNLFADYAIDFMARHRDQPFFLYYPMAFTHTPWDPTPSLDAPGTRTEGGLRHNVEAMDHIVGRIVAALDSLGLREETLVMFTGDNGTEGAGKAEPTERGAHVPFILSYPGVAPEGVVSDELVDLTDVLPTLADFAGAPLPERPIDGVSLGPYLRGEAETHRPWIFSYLHDDRILRDKRWLYESEDLFPGESGGRFFDCGDARTRDACTRIDDLSTNPEAQTAHARFMRILDDLPAPDSLDADPFLHRHEQRRLREAAPQP